MSSDLPPPAVLVASNEVEASFEVRPPSKPALLLTGLSLIATLAMFGCAFAFQSKIALIVALCLACGGAFVAVGAVTALRAHYRVRLDFQKREIFVSERRGMGKVTEWTGDFQQIKSVVPIQNGLELVWENDEPGPTLIMPPDEANRIRPRLSP